MAHELRIPTLGESVHDVQVGAWRKKVGEWADKDENLVEIESEKATVDLAAPVAGVITKILRNEGEMAAVGDVIGYLEEAKQAGSAASAKASAPAGEKTSEKAASKPQASAASTGAGSVASTNSSTHSSGNSTGNSTATKSSGTTSTHGTTHSHVMPAAEAALAKHGLSADEVKATGPGGRLLKEDVARHASSTPPPSPSSSPAPIPAPAPAAAQAPAAPAEISTPGAEKQSGAISTAQGGSRMEETVPMSWVRRRIAQKLVEAQHAGALLTTFNEVDMSAVIALRQQYREAFQQKYNVKLGFMSFVVKAVIESLKPYPELNAEIRGDDIVYHNFYDMGIAVGGGKGLVVPVLRNAERLSFAEIEQTIADFAARAKAGKLKPDELAGGTFTITNGGVFGSLLSTPIVNPPQSGIIGLHAIQDRPVARGGQVVIRPMMYIALTYDHRIVDGREAVGCLLRLKDMLEDPSRMLMDV